MEPIDLTHMMAIDLPERLYVQAASVEESGYCSAARLMRNAADTLLYLQDMGVIIK